MTTPPLTLEETKTVLREDIATCDQNIRICDANLYNEEAALLQKRKAAYELALHHLEAGKRHAELLAEIHQIAAYPSYCATDLIGDPEAESKLRERIADTSALSPQPHQEGHG